MITQRKLLVFMKIVIDMVLIGIDFGSDSCVVTTVIGRRLEALINDHNDRRTP